MNKLLLSIMENSSEFKDNFHILCEHLISEKIISKDNIKNYLKCSYKKRIKPYVKLKKLESKELIAFGGSSDALLNFL